MLKKIFAVGALALGLSFTAANDADAGIFYRRAAPVRRVAARAALPPYPVARRVVAAPVYARPVVYGRAYAPVYAPAPVYGYGYGGGVSVSVGW